MIFCTFLSKITQLRVTDHFDETNFFFWNNLLTDPKPVETTTPGIIKTTEEVDFFCSMFVKKYNNCNILPIFNYH